MRYYFAIPNSTKGLRINSEYGSAGLTALGGAPETRGHYLNFTVITARGDPGSGLEGDTVEPFNRGNFKVLAWPRPTKEHHDSKKLDTFLALNGPELATLHIARNYAALNRLIKTFEPEPQEENHE